MTQKQVVLGFSGGLDTTVCVVWLKEHGYSPVCVTVDVGQGADTPAAVRRAEQLGVPIHVVDARDDFANYFLLPAVKANALYQGVYPLATALSRPLISKIMADVARQSGTTVFAHGCTGKGNDQLRFELALKSLVPNATIIDPIGTDNMSRDEEIEWLKQRGIETEYTRERPYSVDQNLWGRSVCAGVLEDISVAPPEHVFAWTRGIEATPGAHEDVVIDFKAGVPVAIDGAEMSFRAIIEHLNEVGGKHGVGRIDHIEDRVVGIKTRELYEAPAAIILITAHRALETLTLSRRSLAFKRLVEQEYAELAYVGDWFSHHHLDLLAYLQCNQRLVDGSITVRLIKSTCSVVSRKSSLSLYRPSLATYSSASVFDQRAAAGFRHIAAVEKVIAAEQYLLAGAVEKQVYRLAGRDLTRAEGEDE